jgi:hypothetical protein
LMTYHSHQKLGSRKDADRSLSSSSIHGQQCFVNGCADLIRTSLVTSKLQRWTASIGTHRFYYMGT